MELKLFIVIYAGSGLVGGSVGPLPYDYEECLRRIAPMQAKSDAKPEVSKGMRFKCEYLTKHPTITEED